MIIYLDIQTRNNERTRCYCVGRHGEGRSSALWAPKRHLTLNLRSFVRSPSIGSLRTSVHGSRYCTIVESRTHCDRLNTLDYLLDMTESLSLAGHRHFSNPLRYEASLPSPDKSVILHKYTHGSLDSPRLMGITLLLPFADDTMASPNITLPE